MNTQEEATKWEKANMDAIFKWEAEWDIKPNFKVVTYYYKNENCKVQTKIFEIPV